MNTTSRVLVALGAVSLMTYGSAFAQDAAPQAPQAPPSSVSPAVPPSSAQAGSAAQTMTATGDLVSTDVKEKTLTIKTATDEIKIKYDDDTKVTGASRNTAGLATMSGSQVVVRYKKDGASNVASSIEVKPAAGAGPLSRPAPGLDRPASPGGDRPAPGDDPSKPATPRP